jgi:hypothetical protein
MCKVLTCGHLSLGFWCLWWSLYALVLGDDTAFGWACLGAVNMGLAWHWAARIKGENGE